jgi:hypothetical protein
LRFFHAGALLGTMRSRPFADKSICSNQALGAKTKNNNMILRSGYFMGQPRQEQVIFSSRRKQ